MFRVRKQPSWWGICGYEGPRGVELAVGRIRMRLEPVTTLPHFAGSPFLSYLEIEDHAVLVSLGGLDVEDTRRYLHLKFSPMQGVRVTTEDCFLFPPYLPEHSSPVVEVIGSPWIEELEAALHCIDHLATFMQDAHHYLILCRESPVEVVAWEFTWEVLSDSEEQQ
jgi:hypothetical protein